MQRYLLSRLLQALVSIVAASIVIFVVVRLTGDPMQVLMPPEATQADIAAARVAYGFDKSWPEQYGVFLTHAVQGDFGNSLRFRRPALDLVRERYPYSLLLGGAALVFALSVALPVGVYSAVHRGTGLDYFSRGMAAFGQAVPPFWLGLVLILVFGVIFHVLPTCVSAHRPTWSYRPSPSPWPWPGTLLASPGRVCSRYYSRTMC